MTGTRQQSHRYDVALPTRVLDLAPAQLSALGLLPGIAAVSPDLGSWDGSEVMAGSISWLVSRTDGRAVGASVSAGSGRVVARSGTSAYQDLLRARENRLRKLCADWAPDRHPQLAALLTTITHKLAASGEKPGADLDAA